MRLPMCSAALQVLAGPGSSTCVICCAGVTWPRALPQAVTGEAGSTLHLQYMHPINVKILKTCASQGYVHVEQPIVPTHCHETWHEHAHRWSVSRSYDTDIFDPVDVCQVGFCSCMYK